ncbi:signal peptidase II [Dethiosulfatibacter aminovorans DSM 17477]|uniref:Lipoprotein signal peptidase n=1 Tax=Dethiosulfatibacter aminovorans DSM 17477 TaxID=1121476 RepID=A0A1M6DJL6_9FIRM|nr:signal peptidase II [Dethiosulfatibacter aminovorans]SHI73382.1 signal peptidase II [Dethiosulfatibacter aminovorans DSM 17477]
MHIIIVLLLASIDQISKYFVLELLKFSNAVVLIDNFLRLNYVENRGAAFGILQNQQLFFIVITLMVVLAVVVYRIRYKGFNKVANFALDLIIAGALGNLVDRVRLNYVVDFIDVNFWGYYDFPVFNFADICVVVGTLLLALLIILDKYEMDKI